jgi:putative oxidoreductase
MAAHVEAPRSTFQVVLPSRARALRYSVPIGRVLFALLFVTSALTTHLSQGGVGYAASQGVPLANLLGPLSGLLALAGGLSIMLGYKTRWGAAMLIAFLVPVTFMMHRFWGVSDPQTAMMQQVMFMKNLSILGGAFLLLYFGGGPLSMDARARRRRTS